MQVTHRNPIVTWELNRPEQDNGLDINTIQSMELSLTELECESEQKVTFLLIVGHPTVFSTGLDSDLLETCFADAVIFREVVDRINRMLDRLETLPLVSIACVEGTCRLGGLELALACDIIVADDSATFGMAISATTQCRVAAQPSVYRLDLAIRGLFFSSLEMKR